MNTEIQENLNIKTKCNNCDSEILVTTSKKTGGYCLPCKKKNTPWYKINKYFGIFGEITSGIFGLILVMGDVVD